MSNIPQMNINAFREALAEDSELLVIDVREDDEVAAQPMEGVEVHHIPMGEIPQHMNELPKEKHIVIFCRSGGRSQRVAEYLNANGFTNVSNLAGGIIAWSQHS